MHLLLGGRGGHRERPAPREPMRTGRQTSRARRSEAVSDSWGSWWERPLLSRACSCGRACLGSAGAMGRTILPQGMRGATTPSPVHSQAMQPKVIVIDSFGRAQVLVSSGSVAASWALPLGVHRDARYSD